MKKFLAIVAVLAIVLTLSVSAFAAPLTQVGDAANNGLKVDPDKLVSMGVKPNLNGTFTFDGPAGSSGARSPAGSNGATSTPAGSSPQTGFDGTVWMIAMGGLLLAAGVCFVCARKDHE